MYRHAAAAAVVVVVAAAAAAAVGAAEMGLKYPVYCYIIVTKQQRKSRKIATSGFLLVLHGVKRFGFGIIRVNTLLTVLKNKCVNITFVSYYAMPTKRSIVLCALFRSALAKYYTTT